MLIVLKDYGCLVIFKTHNVIQIYFRYVLQFRRETVEEITKRKEEARKEIIPVSEQELEFDPTPYFCGDELRFPIRPKWSPNMSRDELDSREYAYFKDYLLTLKKRNDWDQLSYFELNLETWRQMWRVMEMSDILVWIADVRYPVCVIKFLLFNKLNSY